MKNTSLLAFASVLSLCGLTPQGCTHPISTGVGPDPASSVAAAQEAPPAGAPAHPIDLYKVPLSGLPSMGNPDALVTIVEFTDYECPFCQRAEKTVARLRAAYGEALRVVVAERPLPFHERARPAALAALAADAQGKFEAMHTRLFALGGSLAEDSIVGAAKESGLDLARFAVDRNAAPLAPSEQLADHVGVRGTPTFFVNGRLVVGAQPYETFDAVVSERLAAAQSLVTSGVRSRDVYDTVTAAAADHVAEEAKDAKKEAPGCGGGEGCDAAKGCDAPAGAQPSGDAVESVPIEGAPARGPARASITIVTFSDFECPYCVKAEASLRAVEDAHPGDVRLVFKNRPLAMHPNARLAARAAMAADAQGQFWEFHDRLFTRAGSAIDRAGLLKIAADLNLDTVRFATDLDDPKLADRLTRDEADGDALKVAGTPTFFVNGRRVVGAQPPAVFEAAIAKSR